jgi:hypothetical protein
MGYTDKNTLDKPGQYTISDLSIIPYRITKELSAPKPMEILGITVNFEISEDIFQHNMVGSVIVYDTQDIRTILPITGLEKLSVKFNTPGLPGYDATLDNGQPFQIYKVDKIRLEEGGKNQYYQIFFCSQEMYYNSISKISQAFTGPIEESIEKIVRNKSFLNSKKILQFEPTRTNTKYVIPNWRPYTTIDFLASKSVAGKYNNAGYLFYETASGFKFRSLESMLVKGGAFNRQSRWNFTSQAVRVTDGNPHVDNPVPDITRRMSSVLKYEFDKPVDTLENIQQGMYANRVVTHDAYNKEIKHYDFNYHREFMNQWHCEVKGDGNVPKALLPLAPWNNKGWLSENPLSNLMCFSNTAKVHNDYDFINPGMTIGKIISQKQAYRNMNLTLLVYGNTSIGAGDIITFSMPMLRPAAPNEPEEENPYTSGRYLVMAVKHTVNVDAGNNTMILKCFKDSVRTAYPYEEDTPPEGKDNSESYNIYKQEE